MAENIQTIKRYAVIPKIVEDTLKSAESPIVIFEWFRRPFSDYVSPDSNKIGIMTAYTPLHIILFQYMKTKFIIATSGNHRDEPIAKNQSEAEKNLSEFTDVFLHHSREIFQRVDDSVCALADYGYILFRRARGYAPYPVALKNDNQEEIFAAGANLKSSLLFYKSGFAFLSQYIGDLDNIETEQMYEEVHNNMKSLFNINPSAAIVDYHSQYRSTVFAENKYKKIYKVQHHTAHFASCLAENSYYDNAVGIVMDGFGLGADNKAWGGEIFVKEKNIITRYAHIENYIQPGLDSAAKNPVRMVISYLYTENLLDKIMDKFTYSGYTCEQEVTVTCNGKFNYVTNVFTAEKAGNFEIKLAAGSEQTYNEVKVTVTVIAAGDKSELERLIAFAETLNPDDYYGFDAVTNELAFSNSVLSDKSVTQTRIDGAVASLDAVIKNLRHEESGGGGKLHFLRRRALLQNLLHQLRRDCVRNQAPERRRRH